MVLRECYFESGYCGWTSLGDKDMWKLSVERKLIKYPGKFFKKLKSHTKEQEFYLRQFFAINLSDHLGLSRGLSQAVEGTKYSHWFAIVLRKNLRGNDILKWNGVIIDCSLQLKLTCLTFSPIGYKKNGRRGREAGLSGSRTKGGKRLHCSKSKVPISKAR